jgi:hypothetical protein
MGRPKLPKGEAKGEVYGARLAPDDAKTVSAAIQRSGLDKSEWIRKALLSAATGNIPVS